MQDYVPEGMAAARSKAEGNSHPRTDIIMHVPKLTVTNYFVILRAMF